MSVPLSSTSWLFINNSATVSPSDISTTPVSDICGIRSANNSSKLYIDGAMVNAQTGVDSGSLSTSPVCYGARGTGASTATDFCSYIQQVALWGTFNEADLALIRARVATLKAALGR